MLLSWNQLHYSQAFPRPAFLRRTGIAIEIEWAVPKRETSSTRDRMSFLTTGSLYSLSVRDVRLATSHRTSTATTVTAYLSGSPLSQLKLINEEVWSFRNWTNASLGRLDVPFSPWDSLFQLKDLRQVCNKKSTENLIFFFFLSLLQKIILMNKLSKQNTNPLYWKICNITSVSGICFGLF